MYCAKCGTEHEDKDKFCKGCGVSLHSIENREDSTPKETIKKYHPVVKLGVIALGIILLLGSMELSYKLFTSKNKIITAQTNNVKPQQSKIDPTDSNLSNNVTENIKSIETEPSKIEQPQAEIKDVTNENWQKMKDIMLSKGVVFNEANDMDTFNKREAVSINKSTMVVLEGFKTNIDDFIYQDGKYCLIVDFSILNLSKENYLSSIYDFTLMDSLGYTYDPLLTYNTTGSVEGNIKSLDMKRGEIAFQVLGNQSKFTLRYNVKTGYGALKSQKDSCRVINFNIDINDLRKTTPKILPSDG